MQTFPRGLGEEKSIFFLIFLLGQPLLGDCALSKILVPLLTLCTDALGLLHTPPNIFFCLPFVALAFKVEEVWRGEVLNTENADINKYPVNNRISFTALLKCIMEQIYGYETSKKRSRKLCGPLGGFIS